MSITVVTICFQAEQFIEPTVLSVMRQKNCKFEYIIEDGMSSDATLNKVKEIFCQNENPNIDHYIYTERDQGVYDAMNRAVLRAQGDWILFLNAGDEFEKENILEKMQAVLEKSKADIVCGNAIMRDISGDYLFEADLSLIKYRMPFCHQAVFTKRQLLIENPFDLNFKIIGDYDFFSKAYVEAKKFEKVAQTICVYRMDGISSTKYLLKIREQEDIYYRRGFIHHKYGIHFWIKYLEAFAKLAVLKGIPKKAQLGIRKFYARYVKRYKVISEN